jgi:hypothetical protein
MEPATLSPGNFFSTSLRRASRLWRSTTLRSSASRTQPAIAVKKRRIGWDGILMGCTGESLVLNCSPLLCLRPLCA